MEGTNILSILSTEIPEIYRRMPAPSELHDQ